MPILGIGTDIIEVERIRESIQRNSRFVDRVFTTAEIDYANGRQARYLHLAGRFAAKEAVAKAIGESLSWHDVEIANSPNGRPFVILHGKAKAAVGECVMHITISHTKNYAIATAIMEDAG